MYEHSGSRAHHFVPSNVMMRGWYSRSHFACHLHGKYGRCLTKGTWQFTAEIKHTAKRTIAEARRMSSEFMQHEQQNVRTDPKGCTPCGKTERTIHRDHPQSCLRRPVKREDTQVASVLKKSDHSICQTSSNHNVCTFLTVHHLI